MVEFPQGYFLTTWLLLGLSITLLVFCVAHLRRAPVPAAAGGLGSLLVGLTWGIYLGNGLAVRNAEQPASVFASWTVTRRFCSGRISLGWRW